MSDEDDPREWARTAFRPAKYRGSLPRMRAKALARRRRGDFPIVTAVVVGGVVGGFLVGRWIERKYALRERLKSLHVLGLDAMSGRRN